MIASQVLLGNLTNAWGDVPDERVALKLSLYFKHKDPHEFVIGCLRELRLFRHEKQIRTISRHAGSDEQARSVITTRVT